MISNTKKSIIFGLISGTVLSISVFELCKKATDIKSLFVIILITGILVYIISKLATKLEDEYEK